MSLESLPDELQYTIVELLPISSIKALCATSSAYRQKCRQWSRSLTRSKFGVCPPISMQDPYLTYILCLGHAIIKRMAMNAADKLKQYVAEVYRLQSRRAWTTPLHHGHRLHLELCPKMHLLKEEWVMDGGRIMGFIRNASGIDRTDYNIDEQTYICKLIAAHGCEHGLTQSEVKKIAWYLYLSPFPYK